MEQNGVLDEIRTSLNEIKQYAMLGAKRMLTVDEVALYLGVTKQWVYSLVNQRVLPTYKPNGRRLYFDRSEVDEWVKAGRLDTREQSSATALLNDYANGK